MVTFNELPQSIRLAIKKLNKETEPALNGGVKNHQESLSYDFWCKISDEGLNNSIRRFKEKLEVLEKEYFEQYVLNNYLRPILIGRLSEHDLINIYFSVCPHTRPLYGWYPRLKVFNYGYGKIGLIDLLTKLITYHINYKTQYLLLEKENQLFSHLLSDAKKVVVDAPHRSIRARKEAFRRACKHRCHLKGYDTQFGKK